MTSRQKKLLAQVVVIGLVALTYWVVQRSGDGGDAGTVPTGTPSGATPGIADTAPGPTTVSGGEVEQAFRSGTSGVMVEAAGTVHRVLPDDNQGSRHQKFILRLTSGHTVLVAHNIDLADRVPLAKGDAVELSGQYEWNDRGGVVHWTHHDPRGRHPGGWIRHRGRQYR